jgi:hypothetical protein
VAGALRGVGGNYGFIYQSHNWYWGADGVERDVSQGLFLRIGGPHAGVLIIVNRQLTSFALCLDFRLFIPFAHCLTLRAGLRPLIRCKVVNKEAFKNGLRQLVRAGLGQQLALNTLASWAGSAVSSTGEDAFVTSPGDGLP